MSGDTKPCPECGGRRGWFNAEENVGVSCEFCGASGAVPITDAEREQAGQLRAL